MKIKLNTNTYENLVKLVYKDYTIVSKLENDDIRGLSDLSEYGSFVDNINQLSYKDLYYIDRQTKQLYYPGGTVIINNNDQLIQHYIDEFGRYSEDITRLPDGTILIDFHSNIKNIDIATLGRRENRYFIPSPYVVDDPTSWKTVSDDDIQAIIDTYGSLGEQIITIVMDSYTRAVNYGYTWSNYILVTSLFKKDKLIDDNSTVTMELDYTLTKDQKNEIIELIFDQINELLSKTEISKKTFLSNAKQID